VATAGANYALLAGSSTQVFSVGPATIGTEAVQLQQVGHGQCRFYFSSATVVTLKPYNGNNLIINGVPQQVPSAGVTLSNAGLTASTVYYVYASMAGSVMTLSTSTTGHSTAPNGIETLSTDVTKTLVGMVLPNASAQFQMSGQYLGVLNWFQRQSVECHVPQPGTPITTSSTTYVELSASYVITFLTWGVADMRSSGFVTNSAPATSALLVGIDSSTTGSAPSAWATTTGGLSGAACTSARFTLAEGGHFALLAGKITTGTASFTPDLEVIVEG